MAQVFRCLLESCRKTFATVAERKQHLIDGHRFPSTYDFDSMHVRRRRPQTRPAQGFQRAAPKGKPARNAQDSATATAASKRSSDGGELISSVVRHAPATATIFLALQTLSNLRCCIPDPRCLGDLTAPFTDCHRTSSARRPDGGCAVYGDASSRNEEDVWIQSTAATCSTAVLRAHRRGCTSAGPQGWRPRPWAGSATVRESRLSHVSSAQTSALDRNPWMMELTLFPLHLHLLNLALGAISVMKKPKFGQEQPV